MAPINKPTVGQPGWNIAVDALIDRVNVHDANPLVTADTAGAAVGTAYVLSPTSASPLAFGLTEVAAPNLTVVEHGSTAGTARPTGVVRVLWLGSVRPANIAVGDIYFEVSTTPVPFSPADVADMAAWYDAASLSLADAASMTTWADRSSNARTLTAVTGSATYAAAGLGAGHPSVHFAASCYMDTAAFTGITTPITVFVVATISDQTGTQALIDGTTSTTRMALYKSGTGGTDAWGISRNTAVPAANGGADNAKHLFRILAGKPGVVGSSLFVDGTQVITGSDAGGATVNALRVGGRYDATQLATADIGELIYYSRSLDAGEITQVTTYLTTKWGL